jgi:hypothetical protein
MSYTEVKEASCDTNKYSKKDGDMIKKHLIIKATQQMVTTDKERYF